MNVIKETAFSRHKRTDTHRSSQMLKLQAQDLYKVNPDQIPTL